MSDDDSDLAILAPDLRAEYLPAVVETVDQALVMVDRAYHALSAAVTFQDTRQVRNAAVAAAAYAREANDTRLLSRATELRTRAERKAGQMLRESAEKGERDKGAGGDRRSPSSDATVKPATLAQIGVTRDQSSKWQQVAALSDEDFEAALETTQAVMHEVSAPKVLRAVKQAKASHAPTIVDADDDAVATSAPRLPTDDEQAVAFYNAVRSLGEMTLNATELRVALPYYQHGRITENIGSALALLQEVNDTWKT